MTAADLELPESGAVLADLALWDMRIDAATSGEEVDALFEETPLLPGVIVMDGERIAALLARRTFYDLTNRSFSRQVFLRHPISLLVESLPPAEPAVVPSQLSIEAALDAALARASGHVYDPLIVDSGDALHLLEIEVLMRAAAAALTAANREKDWLLGELQRTGT